MYTFRAGKLLREIESLRTPILLGHTKRASDSTWTERDRRRRGKYHHELVAKQEKAVMVKALKNSIKLATSGRNKHYLASR